MNAMYSMIRTICMYSIGPADNIGPADSILYAVLSTFVFSVKGCFKSTSTCSTFEITMMHRENCTIQHCKSWT